MPILSQIVLEEPALHQLQVPIVAVDQRTSQLTVEAEERVIRWVEDLASYRENHVLRDSGPPPIDIDTRHRPYNHAPIHHGYTARTGISLLARPVPPAVSTPLRRFVNLYAQPLAGQDSPYHLPQWTWPCHELSIPPHSPLGGTTRVTSNGGKVSRPSAPRETSKDSAAPPPTFSKVICPPHPRKDNGAGKGVSATAPPRHAEAPTFIYREGMYSSALAPEGDEIIPVLPRRRDVYPIVQQESAGTRKESTSTLHIAAPVQDQQTAGEKHSAFALSDSEINPVSPSQRPRSESVSTQLERTCSDGGSSTSALTPTDNASPDSCVQKGHSACLVSAVNGCESHGSHGTSVKGFPSHAPRSVEGTYERLTPNQTKPNVHTPTEPMAELKAQNRMFEDPYTLLPSCLKEELDILV